MLANDRYNSAFKGLTSALDGGGWSTPRPGRFTPGSLGTHRTGGWVGPRDGLECAENLAPHRDSIHRLSIP